LNDEAAINRRYHGEEIRTTVMKLTSALSEAARSYRSISEISPEGAAESGGSLARQKKLTRRWLAAAAVKLALTRRKQ